MAPPSEPDRPRASHATVDPAHTYGAPQVTAKLPAPAPGATKSRPDNVLIASLIALIMSSFVLVGGGLIAVTYLASRDDYISLFEDPMMKDAIVSSGMSAASLARASFIVGGIAAVLSLAAVLAAGATLAGRAEGRMALVILSVATVLISFAAFPFGLVWAAAAIATLVLLRKPDARAWFARS